MRAHGADRCHTPQFRPTGTQNGQQREAAGSLEGSQAVTVEYVAASVPPLGVPLLQGYAALEFLVWATLKTPEQIERSKQASWRKHRKEAAKKEKEAAKEEEEEEASSSQRKRKKRKKKKLPKTRGPLLPQVPVRSCSSSTRSSSSWRSGRSTWLSRVLTISTAVVTSTLV